MSYDPEGHLEELMIFGAIATNSTNSAGSDYYISALSHFNAKPVMSALTEAIPALEQKVTRPPGCTWTCGDHRLIHYIIWLNDRDGWSRERIADWLDTLNVDLRFNPTEKEKENA